MGSITTLIVYVLLIQFCVITPILFFFWLRALNSSSDSFIGLIMKTLFLIAIAPGLFKYYVVLTLFLLSITIAGYMISIGSIIGTIFFLLIAMLTLHELLTARSLM